MSDHVGIGNRAAPNWPWDVLTLTGFFAALWLGSARLFRKAALEGKQAT